MHDESKTRNKGKDTLSRIEDETRKQNPTPEAIIGTKTRTLFEQNQYPLRTQNRNTTTSHQQGPRSQPPFKTENTSDNTTFRPIEHDQQPPLHAFVHSSLDRNKKRKL